MAGATGVDEGAFGSGTRSNSNYHRFVSDVTKCIDIVQSDGTNPANASAVSLDADGFTINWAAVAGSHVVAWYAIG